MSWTLLENSLLVATLTTVLASLAGFGSALCLAGMAPRPRRWLLLGTVAALALPPFLVTNCWLDLLGATGVFHRWLPVNLFSMGGTVWILGLLFWPLSTVAVLTAWEPLEPSQLEAEALLRGTALVRWLLWPMARPRLSLAAVLIFVLALNNFTVPAILQVKVLPAVLWVNFNTNLQAGAALAAGWPLLAAPLLLWLWLGRAGEAHWPRLEGGLSPQLFRRHLGRGWLLASRTAAAICFGLSVGLPLLQLAAGRRTWIELWPALAAGASALFHSVFFAAAAATLAVLPAVLWSPTDWVRAGRNPRSSPEGGSRGGRLMRACLWLPFLVPGIFLGLALIWALNRPALAWFYGSAAVVLLALSVRYLAPGWFGAAAALRGVDIDLLEAARLEGARGWALFRRIVWPQVAPQLAAVWYAVYLLCLWDVETLLLVLPPGGETLAARIFNLLHYGHSGQVNALCAWLLAAALLPLGLWHAGRALGRCLAGCGPGCWPGRNGAMGAATCLLLAVTFPGCQPPDASRQAPLRSRLFRRVEVIGTRGVGPGEFNKPRSLTVDAQDNLYVADMTGRVQKFSPEGKYLLSWQLPVTELGKPKGMCRDKEGGIVVLEPHYQRVNHFSTHGQLLARWGGHLTNGGSFALPRAVAVNSRNEVIVSEYTLAERVQVFAPRGSRRLFEFGRAGTGPGEFNRPEGVAVDAQDRIYVADSCNHRLQVFSPEGRLLRMHGRAGTGPGQFSYPYDVQVDAAGRQFVCEFGNSRVQVFDAADQFLEILGRPGAAPGEFSNPWSLALDSAGNLYVADSQNHRVQKFVALARDK
jgi:ABC-type Fe3+ transport system permease subunit/DNA-binding beta-propeller fold protein YncE